MLSPADAALVKRDPGLPGLPVLLDRDAFADVLRALYPIGNVETVEPRYVRYKPGTSCLVGYHVHAGGDTVHAYARAHHPASGAKLEKASQRPGVPSPLGGGIAIDADRGIAVYPFPNDHELDALATLGDAAARRRLLEEVLPAGTDPGTGRIETLRYKPARRLVARLSGEDGVAAVLRFYTTEDYARIRDNVDRFESRSSLRVPARLGRSNRLQVAAYEWMEGTSLRDALVARQVEAASCREVGAAVAALHAQRSSRLAVVTSAEAYAALIADAAAALAPSSPELVERATRVAQRISSRFAMRHWRMRRAVHGDLSADQVVIGDAAVAIVDFDRAGLGDPRMDLGTFRARLEYDALVGAIAPDVVDAVIAALLDGYGEASGKDAVRRIAKFAAAELLLLAVEPFRSRQTDWPELTQRIIARAEVLARGRRA